ncbi:hypothetical protein [Longispora albida]|uniref:hypothetical protein n=1 Tax=Longispora albida TaxID=203523 RepID=UPI00037FE750|nr:hypothetical protein [Longispora albida]
MTWRDYATLAGQLEAHRAVQAASAAGHAGARSTLGAELAAIDEILSGQRERIGRLYEQLDLAEPVLAGQPPPVPDLAEGLRRAREAAERAGTQLTAVEAGSRRSPRLAHWSASMRNSVVYAATSAGAFLLGLAIVLSASGGWLLLILPLLIILPWLAFGIGGSAIGWLYTPAVGGKPPRTRPLGLAICLAPAAPLLVLWYFLWLFGGE